MILLKGTITNLKLPEGEFVERNQSEYVAAGPNLADFEAGNTTAQLGAGRGRHGVMDNTELTLGRTGRVLAFKVFCANFWGIFFFVACRRVLFVLLAVCFSSTFHSLRNISRI